MMNAKEALGNNIKRLRKSKGLTQVQLQGITGITQGTISQLELGNNWPDHKTVEMLALAFNCEETDLFKPAK